MHRIGIIGGGPAGLFLYKKICGEVRQGLTVFIFEKGNQLGAGMPYSDLGAEDEHVTNVSGNEIPELPESVAEWISNAPIELQEHFGISSVNFNDFKVLPRLFFGKYLQDQFNNMIEDFSKKGIETIVKKNCEITDIEDHPESGNVTLTSGSGEQIELDMAVICIGHRWPHNKEVPENGYFDSPYPPAKLKNQKAFPVAIRGSSLTAIDAIRTLSRLHGTYRYDDQDKMHYELKIDSTDFKIVLHSLFGLLPAVRFHLEDTQLSRGLLLTESEVDEMRRVDNGFVSLDELFNRNFKETFREHDPDFFNSIKELTIEDFVDQIMSGRKQADSFALFEAEYLQAERSIERRESVYWKEMLASLSYTLNYPAKYFSAEDMLRLKKVLMPLVSVVIAFVPQSSARELLALKAAGVLDIVSVDRDSKVELQETGIVYYYTDSTGNQQAVAYPLFIDCIGQPHYMLKDFPFESLKKKGSVSYATLRFRSDDVAKKLALEGNDDIRCQPSGYVLQVPGLCIDDDFQLVDQQGNSSKRVFIMAVPYIGGYNPDYSGLDFCETAATRIAKNIASELSSGFEDNKKAPC